MEFAVARALYQSVVASAVKCADIDKGDLIIITGKSADIVGIARTVHSKSIELVTHAGIQTIDHPDARFIHIIRKANMNDLNLRNHTEYERDLQDMTKATHGREGNSSEKNEFGPVTDSDKSALPTSKVSSLTRLNLRNRA